MIFHNDNDVEVVMRGHATCCGQPMQLVSIVLVANGGEIHVTRCPSCERTVSKSLFPFVDDAES